MKIVFILNLSGFFMHIISTRSCSWISYFYLGITTALAAFSYSVQCFAINDFI